MTISISSLEKSVKVLANKLEGKGFTICEIDTFKDGTKGGMYGGSYVELTISHNDFWETYKFFTVYGGGRNLEFCNSKWSIMKSEFLSILSKQISRNYSIIL